MESNKWALHMQGDTYQVHANNVDVPLSCAAVGLPMCGLEAIVRLANQSSMDSLAVKPQPK